MQFYEYPEEHWGTLLPRVSEEGQDLISELVRYESGARMTALKVSTNLQSDDTELTVYRSLNTLTFALSSARARSRNVGSTIM